MPDEQSPLDSTPSDVADPILTVPLAELTVGHLVHLGIVGIDREKQPPDSEPQYALRLNQADLATLVQLLSASLQAFPSASAARKASAKKVATKRSAPKKASAKKAPVTKALARKAPSKKAASNKVKPRK